MTEQVPEQKAAPTIASTPRDIERLILSMYAVASNGLNVTPGNALKVPEVLACINVIAQSMSMLPFSVLEKTETGRQKRKDIDIYRVLGQKPNAYQSAVEFRRTMTFNAAWRGNSYAKIVRTRKRLLELWPIPNDSIRPILNDDWSITYEIRGANTGAIEYLSQSEVFHLRGPICPQGWLSESPIELAKDAIGTMIAIDRFSGKYFNGGAKAKGAFRLPTMESLDDDAFDRLKSTLNEALESDLAPLFEQGLEWVKMDYSARESQLDSILHAQIHKICRIWRIQPHMIQELADATFSNIEHQSREFVDHTLMPWIQLWESAVKTQLMDPTNDDVYPKISAQALLRGDNATRAAFYTAAVGGPWMSPDEAREYEDMDVIDGGDDLLRPMNMTAANDPQTTASAEETDNNADDTDTTENIENSETTDKND